VVVGADFYAADNLIVFVAKQTPGLTYLTFGVAYIERRYC